MSLKQGDAIVADQVIPVFTAGEAGSAGDALALNLSDKKVYKASASAWAYRLNFIGFAISDYTSGGSVPVNVTQIVSEKTGLTSGSYYYLSDTNGAISTSPGTISRKIGLATSTTRIWRPKNGAPVSGMIHRVLSGSTIYVHAMLNQNGIRPSVTINSITPISNGNVGPQSYSTVLAPDDVVTVVEESGNGSDGNAYLRILDI